MRILTSARSVHEAWNVLHIRCDCDPRADQLTVFESGLALRLVDRLAPGVACKFPVRREPHEKDPIIFMRSPATRAKAGPRVCRHRQSPQVETRPSGSTVCDSPA